MDAKKLEEKLDKIDGRLSSIDITLAKQEVNLQEHMRRTQLNEQAIEKITENLIPINKHVTMLEGVLKFFGVLAVLGSVLTSIIKLIDII